MKLKIVETSLNLRIEKGRDRMDYTLSKEVADKQLALMADVYCNVEFMDCNNGDYFKAFKDAGYNIYTAVDEPRHRGVMYAVKKEYVVEEICSMQDPHMFHIRVSKEDEAVDLITLRVLVAGCNDADFIDRKEQWDRVMAYIDELDSSRNLVLTGDWNHGVIAEFYTEEHARRFFNYQMIVEMLKEKNIELFEIDGMSYRGYMKIDHIASRGDIKVVNAVYREVFKEKSSIGVPDHKLIVAELMSA